MSGLPRRYNVALRETTSRQYAFRDHTRTTATGRELPGRTIADARSQRVEEGHKRRHDRNRAEH
jgi:hypothetical protein